jgi:hypothetical protein
MSQINLVSVVIYRRFDIRILFFCIQIFVIHRFSLDYPDILNKLTQMNNFLAKECFSFGIRGFGIRGTFRERNPRE